jgi:hypothetical protein
MNTIVVLWKKEWSKMMDKVNVEERKAYEKPAVVHTQVLESVAGACPVGEPTNGKTGTDDTCATVNS